MGTLLNGRYELGDVIGSGGMGRVHRAVDTRLARPVAVKILRSGGQEDPTARARFRAEATLAGSLHHPGIAQVYDFGEDESTPEHDPFIVMQLVDGMPLSKVLAERGAIVPSGVAAVVGQIADALAAAHAKGIVHRDLKPSNIIVTPDGNAVLVDFGIAWSAGSEPLTATGSVIGTAEYFSPEQAAGRPATPRSDLYSLGVVAHHCLTGQSPFKRDTPVATAMAQMSAEMPPLPAAVPAALATLVASLTQKDPEDRPSSAAVVSSLARAESPGTAVLAPATTVAPAPTAVVPAAAGTRVGAALPPPLLPPPGPRNDFDDRDGRRRAGWLPFAIGAIVVLLAVLVGLQALAGGNDTPSAADSSSTPTASSTPTDDEPTDEPSPTEDEPSEPSTVTVDPDDLIGQSYDDAADQLDELGLSVRRVDAPSSEEPGTVTAVSPSGSVDEGDTITLTVAQAQATEEPDSAGADAEADDDDDATEGAGKADKSAAGKGNKKA